MNIEPIRCFLVSLGHRRKALGIPWDALGARSGASRATLYRLLNDHQATISFQTVLAVAEALGVRIHGAAGSLQADAIDVEKLLDQQAERQACKLVSMVQGTMSLEAQALPPKKTTALLKTMKRRLLAGPKHKLWYD